MKPWRSYFRFITLRSITLTLLVLTVLSLGLVTAFQSTRPSVSGITRYYQLGAAPVEKLDDFINAPNAAKAMYRFTLTPGRWPVMYTRIMADDCVGAVRINGRAVYIPEDKRCTYPDGVFMNMLPYLHDGPNVVDIEISNVAGLMGLRTDFWPAPFNAVPVLVALAYASGVVLLLLRWKFHERVGLKIMALLFTSLFILMFQYSVTGYYEYTHDVIGHMDYIRYIVGEHRLPLPTTWQSQQPPLYYLAATVFYAIGAALGVADPLNASRVLSLLCYTGFLLVALLTLRLFFERGWLLITAAALVLFWPEGFTVAGRISNDVPIHLTHMLFLYYLVRWNAQRCDHDLRASVCMAFLSLMIKGNAIISLFTVFVFCIIALWRRQITWERLLNWPVVAIMPVALLVNFGRTLYYRTQGFHVNFLMNIEPPEMNRFITPGKVQDYVYFDVPGFIRDPFFFSTPPIGSEFYWNAFFKTLILGEWWWQSPLLASLISATFVILIAYTAYFLFARITTRNFETYLPLLVMLGAMLGASMISRTMVPWPTQCNARYIFTSMVILVIFFTKCLQYCLAERKVIAASAAWSASITFCAASAAMLLIEHPILMRYLL